MRSRTLVAADRAALHTKIQTLRDELHAIHQAAEAESRDLTSGESQRVERQDRALAKLIEQSEAVDDELRAALRSEVSAGKFYTEPGGHDPSPPSMTRVASRNPLTEARSQVETRALRNVERHLKADAIAPKAADRAEALIRSQSDRQWLAARLIAATGSEAYESAFWRIAQNPTGAQFELDQSEIQAVREARSVMVERAMSVGTDSEGGFLVPFQLDPTINLSSDGQLNPLRQISRIVQTVSNEWRGVTSEGGSASYKAEGAEAEDDSPTLVQPTIPMLRADSFIPYSFELAQDFTQLRAELGTILSDAKDELESSAFIGGTGTVEPEGLVATLGTASHVETAGSAVFAVADVYALKQSLPPRFAPRGVFLASQPILDTVYRFVGTGDANEPPLMGQDGRILRRPTYEVSTMSATAGTADQVMLYGNPRQFVIADRIGMTISVVNHLFGSNRRPTGMSGLFAFWRNNSKILIPNAWRLLKVKAS